MAYILLFAAANIIIASIWFIKRRRKKKKVGGFPYSRNKKRFISLPGMIYNNAAAGAEVRTRAGSSLSGPGVGI
jgi:hypothetical protein